MAVISTLCTQSVSALALSKTIVLITENRKKKDKIKKEVIVFLLT